MRSAVEERRPLDLERFLRVVDGMYAAACAETSWDRALEELCRVGGLSACALSSIDPLEPRPVLRAAYGLRDLATGVAPGRTPRNPLLTDGVLRSMPGTVWHDRRVMPPALLASTPFWTDWMQPQSFVSWACVIVGRNGGQVVCLEVYNRRGDTSCGIYGDDLLARLAPHLCRAWRLGKMARAALQHEAALFSVASPSEPHRAASPASDDAGARSVNRLRIEFGLTRAEARLALNLAEGASLASMAQAFGVKLTTIRSQLQQVFAKTGTSRQAELVTLLLSHGYDGDRARSVEPAQKAPRARSGYGLPAALLQDA